MNKKNIPVPVAESNGNDEDEIALTGNLMKSLSGTRETVGKRRRRHAKGKRPEILVTNFDGESAVRAALRLWSDGNFHSSKGLPDHEPFSRLVKVKPNELDKYPSLDEQDRYAKKKRNLILKVVHALSLVGILRIKLQTSGSVYVLTPLGVKVVQGLALLDALDQAGISYDEAIQKLFPDQTERLEIREKG